MVTRKSIPPSISSTALIEKSKVFVRRSLGAKSRSDLAEYQLWASLALELLAKGALAGIHPSLIVDTKKNENGLLTAAGIEVDARVATIGANEAYIRLKHTAAPRFNHGVYESCKGMADLRNAHLHSGELPFDGRSNDIWEGGFWHACEVVLESMDSTLDDWLGTTDAEAPKALIKAASEAKREAAKRRISEAAKKFQSDYPKKKDRDELIHKSEANRPYLFAKAFRRSLDSHWIENCPSCNAKAIAGGDKTYESLADNQDPADDGYEIVERGYAAEELFCPTCGLRLEGEDALSAADIDIQYEETDEREIEYEPDYGND